MEKIYDVFISYRRDKGQDLARALQLGLENRGLRVFFDLEELRGGKFNEKLYTSIEQSKNVILLMTEGALERCTNENDWVRLELLHAFSKGINVVPVSPLDCPRSFPEKLPPELEELRSLQIAVLDKNDLFRQTVDEIITKYLLDIEIADSKEQKEAERVFLELARRYKSNDGEIDAEERADLEKKAKEFKITAVRREALIQQVEHEFLDASGLLGIEKAESDSSIQYDVFISYRHDGGFSDARMMYDRLTQAGFTVSFDMDTLKNGSFDDELLRRIAGCRNFVILLSKDCFRRTLEGCKREDDWLRIELATALQYKKNIVTVMLPGFSFPAKLPPDINEVRHKNGPPYSQAYIDTFYQKLISDFLVNVDKTDAHLQSNQTQDELLADKTSSEEYDDVFEEILGDDAEFCREEAQCAYSSIPRLIPFTELKRLDETWQEAEGNFKNGDHRLAARLYMKVLELSSQIKPSSLPFIAQMANDGIDSHNENWFKTALEKAKNDNNADYQYGIGLLYSLGIGVERDVSAAFRWFNDAASNGHVKALTAVGAAFAMGEGVEVDYAKAFDYLNRADESGDTTASERLGYLYQKGFGLPDKDYHKAMDYYRKAAELDNSDAMLAIGEMIENGQGGLPDMQKAIGWYRLAVSKGNAVAQMKMAQLLLTGKGGERNYSEGIKLARLSVNQGNADALALLGKAYEEGWGMAIDKQKAEELYRSALAKGSVLAKGYLADLEAEIQYGNAMRYLEGKLGETIDYREARMWLKKSAEQGHAAAMEQLGFLCERGLGGDFDIVAAKSWYEKAAEKGNVPAMVDLGSLYFQGDAGIEKDYQKALELFKRATKVWRSVDNASQWKVLNAFYCLGQMYEKGFGVEKNMALAMRFYLTGAHNGDLRCAFQLGQIFRNGRQGIPVSTENANRWFKFCAAHEGEIHSEDDRAMRIIGHLYYLGIGEKVKDYDLANLWYEKSAKLGNVLAMYDLGSGYRLGKGVPQDIYKALDYSMKAAERGHVYSMNLVSWIYYKGLGEIEIDYSKAYKWAMKAANENFHQAMETLYRMYRDGTGVEKDEKEALKWLSKAVEGSAAAMSAMGECYEYGYLGVEIDIPKAFSLYQKAADKGNVMGMYDLGRCYWQGIGTPQDKGEALRWLLSAANQKDDDLHYDQKAYQLLEDMYYGNNDFKAKVEEFDIIDAGSNKTALSLLGKRNVHDKNFLRAMECYMAAAERGDAKAQNNLGWIYYAGKGTPRNFQKAFEWTKRAVDNGCYAGMETLFRMYRDGDGVERNDTEALKWLQKAAESVSEDSKENSCPISELGECYEYGLLGVAIDPHKAFEYYRTAASHDWSPGKYNLGRCYLRGIGTEKNVQCAIGYLKEASKIEDIDDYKYQKLAMRLLADIYRNGEGVEINEDLAIYWQEEAEKVRLPCQSKIEKNDGTA